MSSKCAICMHSEAIKIIQDLEWTVMVSGKLGLVFIMWMFVNLFLNACHYWECVFHPLQMTSSLFAIFCTLFCMWSWVFIFLSLAVFGLFLELSAPSAGCNVNLLHVSFILCLVRTPTCLPMQLAFCMHAFTIWCDSGQSITIATNGRASLCRSPPLSRASLTWLSKSVPQVMIQQQRLVWVIQIVAYMGRQTIQDTRCYSNKTFQKPVVAEFKQYLR